MKIKLVFGDNDPWHLSLVPLLLFAGGFLCLCGGGLLTALAGGAWWLLLSAAGLVPICIGARNMVRERRDYDRALTEKENEAARGIGS